MALSASSSARRPEALSPPAATAASAAVASAAAADGEASGEVAVVGADGVAEDVVRVDGDRVARARPQLGAQLQLALRLERRRRARGPHVAPHLARGTSEAPVARTAQAERARPLQVSKPRVARMSQEVHG